MVLSSRLDDAGTDQAGTPLRLLVFDSGIGGLTVVAEIRKLLPGADLTYVADDAAFPYGTWDEDALVTHVVALVGRLIAAHRPDLVVIACNTASTLVLPALRAAHDVPFIGTVPAIKSASTQTLSGLISVLATPGTVKRDYTRALIDTYASHRSVTLVGSTRLAAMAEGVLCGEAIDDDGILAEIAPCFRQIGDRRTDAIVLGCTHYPLLIGAFERLAPWPVTWIDPAPAIARRVEVLAEGRGGGLGSHRGQALFTSGRSVVPVLARVLDGYGLDVAGQAPL